MKCACGRGELKLLSLSFLQHNNTALVKSLRTKFFILNFIPVHPDCILLISQSGTERISPAPVWPITVVGLFVLVFFCNKTKWLGYFFVQSSKDRLAKEL